MPKLEPVPQTLSVSTIRPGQHRPLDPATVKRLAESIREVGILNPIAVKRLDADPGEATFVVVAGDHRLAAAISIGLRNVPVHVLDLSNLQAQIASIDENLYRHALSPAEETAAIAKRKTLWDAVHEVAVGETRPASGDLPHAPAPRPSAVANDGSGTEAKPRSGGTGGRGKKAFAQEMAEQTGMSRTTAHRIAKRADVLGEAAAEIVGTSLDEPGELDALAAADAKTRADLIQRAKSGEKVSAKPAAPAKAKAAPAQPAAVDLPPAPAMAYTPEDYINQFIRALHACAANLSIDEVARYRITDRMSSAERQLIYSLSIEPAMSGVQAGLYDAAPAMPKPAIGAPAAPAVPVPEANDHHVGTDGFLRSFGADRPQTPGVGRWHPNPDTPDLLGPSAADQAGAVGA
ncbi:MAG TPA: ParB/RepB/Spo0J family partition protein [Rhodanobacteraceae bacterium]